MDSPTGESAQASEGHVEDSSPSVDKQATVSSMGPNQSLTLDAGPTVDTLIEARWRASRGHQSETGLAELTKAFEKRHGRIIKEYFCETIRGGTVLTQHTIKSRWQLIQKLREAPTWQGLFREQRVADMHIHMRYPQEAIVSVSPDFEEALWRCSALSTKANQLLRTKNSQMIHLQMHSLLVYLLSCLDTLSAVQDLEEKTQRIGAALKRANAELDGAEEMYASCAAWGAQGSYSKGMFYGITVLMAVVAALVMIQRGEAYPELDRFLVGLGAGGVGAIVSVMQ